MQGDKYRNRHHTGIIFIPPKGGTDRNVGGARGRPIWPLAGRGVGPSFS